MQYLPRQSTVLRIGAHQPLFAEGDALDRLFPARHLSLHVLLFHPYVPPLVRMMAQAREQRWAANGLQHRCDLLDRVPCRLGRLLFATAVLVVIAVAALVVRVCLRSDSHFRFDSAGLVAFAVLLEHFLGLTLVAGGRLWEPTCFVVEKRLC